MARSDLLKTEFRALLSDASYINTNAGSRADAYVEVVEEDIGNFYRLIRLGDMATDMERHGDRLIGDIRMGKDTFAPME